MNLWNARNDRPSLPRPWSSLGVAALVLPLVTACGSSGCGGSSSGSGKQPVGRAVEPCSLLLRDEAQKALATSLDRTQDSPDTCQYTTPSTVPSGQIESVTLQVYADRAASYDEYVAQAKATVAVDGLGEKARFNGLQLIVLFKRDFFVVMVQSGKKTEAVRLDVAKSVATTVIGRL